jgi:hypothetical protein
MKRVKRSVRNLRRKMCLLLPVIREQRRLQTQRNFIRRLK